jgi:hypothetical protein
MPEANGRSVLVLDSGKKADVLMSLLQRNREEITFWQNSLFTASFWFNAGTLALVAFAFEKAREPSLAIFVGAGIFGLAIFYSIFASVAKSAIEHTGGDLVRIQDALLLTGIGEYFKDTWVYTPGHDWLPQAYIRWLRLLNLIISAGGILLLVFRVA